MEQSNTVPWIEKYRPTQFDDIVLDKINRQLFRNIIEKNYFPNLLFYGPPGTGKTTTVINLINEYQTKYNRRNKSTIIHLNASDERGIDIIRNQINQFAKSMNLFEPGLKFVILDEIDYMTKNAQQALKYLLETCNHNVRFCLICNYISKIDELLKNEFILVRFNQLPKADIYSFIKTILEKEGISIPDKTIEDIQSMYNSDIRSMINYIQLNHCTFRANLGSETLLSASWDKAILNTEVVTEIETRFADPQYTTPNMLQYIHDISIRYNTDKKTILTRYFNYVIRGSAASPAMSDFVGLLPDILHNTHVDVESILAIIRDFYLRHPPPTNKIETI